MVKPLHHQLPQTVSIADGYAIAPAVSLSMIAVAWAVLRIGFGE
jgi:hypothetical protein